MCGGDCGQQIENAINLPQVLEIVALTAAPLGALVSVGASIIVLERTRRAIAISMLAIMFGLAFVTFADEAFGVYLPNKLIEVLGTMGVLTFIFLGLVSITYWPTQNRLVN